MTAREVADWLPLAASPAFGAMALWSGLNDSQPTAALCAAAGVSPLGGMTVMYLLMSVIHLAPWLKMLSERSDRSEQRQ